MIEGTVKWFNRNKGYGFIQGDDGQEYFVHHTALEKGTFIRENDKVSFEPVETERGKQAQKVTLLQKGSEIESGGDEATEEFAEEAPAEEESAEEAAEEPAEEAAEETTEEEEKKD